MRANTIRERWTDRRPATNAWCSIGSPYSAEILAASGYDAVTVDLQHGMFGVDAAITMLQAISAQAATPMVRVPFSSFWITASAAAPRPPSGKNGRNRGSWSSVSHILWTAAQLLFQLTGSIYCHA